MMTGFIKELKGLMRELFDQEQEIKALKDRVKELEEEVSEIDDENDLILVMERKLRDFLNKTTRGKELLSAFNAKNNRR